MVNNYDKLVAGIRKAFVKKVRSLRRVTIDSFLRRKGNDGPAVYLIFDPRGRLMYVGDATKVRSRLQYHLSPKSTCGLLWFVCKVKGIVTGALACHRCPCGYLTMCRLGQDAATPAQEVLEISEKIRKTYTVALLEKNRGTGSDLERLVTNVLKPMYGGFDSDR